uniref:AP2/ERF domain-containing protein n=1 Tax=Triticum urartu TaxID=4572 RepID=A0A8R7QXW7_TRIUA
MCRAIITVGGEKRYLGTWKDPEKAARANDWMTIQHYGARVRLNFPGDRAIAELFAPKDMRFATKAEEKEHRQAKAQLTYKRQQ